MSTSTAPITLTVNGEPRDLSKGTALPNLLRQMDIDPDAATGIAVAVNDGVIPRGEWAETTLEEGDRVEVITAQQGG